MEIGLKIGFISFLVVVLVFGYIAHDLCNDTDKSTD